MQWNGGEIERTSQGLWPRCSSRLVIDLVNTVTLICESMWARWCRILGDWTRKLHHDRHVRGRLWKAIEDVENKIWGGNLGNSVYTRIKLHPRRFRKNKRSKYAKRREMNAHGTPGRPMWDCSEDSEDENCVRYIYWWLLLILCLHCAHIRARLGLGHMVIFLARKQSSTAYTVDTFHVRWRL
jgi:hypothetical protein